MLFGLLFLRPQLSLEAPPRLSGNCFEVFYWQWALVEGL
jgi:hypothetical protein